MPTLAKAKVWMVESFFRKEIFELIFFCVNEQHRNFMQSDYIGVLFADDDGVEMERKLCRFLHILRHFHCCFVSTELFTRTWNCTRAKNFHYQKRQQTFNLVFHEIFTLLKHFILWFSSSSFRQTVRSPLSCVCEWTEM